MRHRSAPQLLVAAAAVVLLAASVIGYVSRDTESQPSKSPNTVRIADFAFDPDGIKVSVGDTVTWSNDDEFVHTVTSQSRGPLNSGEIGAGRTYEATFAAAGSYEYLCTIHASMRGVIEVGPG